MSHITEISITGLAGRKDVYHQKLNRDVNVFFGSNGSGKTSLLRIIHSAMLGDASLLQSVPFKRAEIKLFSIDYEKIFTRRIAKNTANRKGKLTRDPSSDSSLVLSEHILTGEKSKAGLRWATSPVLKSQARFANTYLPTSRLYLGLGSDYYDSMHTPERSEEALDTYFASSLERLWTSYSADVLSNVNKAQQDGLASILNAVLTTSRPTRKGSKEIDSEIAFERVATFLKRQGSPQILASLAEFKLRYKKDAKLRSIVSDINEVERGIEKAMTPRNQLQSLIQRMFGETKVIFRDKEIKITARDKTQISLTALSSGQKQVLKIFIETLMAGSNSLMIDEPEISMHVDWQKRLIASTRQLNPNAQLILATHSPEIMADLPDDKIFRL